MTDIVERLHRAFVGQPAARIFSWPRRLLHDAIAAIEERDRRIAELEAGSDTRSALSWDDDRLLLGSLEVGSAFDAGPMRLARRGGRWRAWLSAGDEDGHIGWYETQASARAAVESAVLRAISTPPTGESDG